MSESDGVLALPDPRRDDELLYDLALGAESDADLAKKYGYKNVQSIWNKRSRNKARIDEIRESRPRQLDVVHAEKFSDLQIMKPLARMAGFNEAWLMAMRKLLEIDARSYNPVTGEARPQSAAEAQQFKLYYGVMERAARAAVELSGELPGRLSWKSLGYSRIQPRHIDDRSPTKPSDLDGESDSEVPSMRREFAPWRRPTLGLGDVDLGPEFNERVQRLARGIPEPEDLDMFDWSAFDEEEPEPDVQAESVPEPDPEPALEPVAEPSPFVASVAAAMRGTLALEVEPEPVPEVAPAVPERKQRRLFGGRTPTVPAPVAPDVERAAMALAAQIWSYGSRPRARLFAGDQPGSGRGVSGICGGYAMGGRR
jgi:hypothetical protein